MMPELRRAEGFERFFAGLPEHRSSAVTVGFKDCFGCGPEHEIGLRVRCFRKDGGIVSPIVIPRRYAGPPAAAHGGIVAAYLDEVGAAAAMSHGGRVYVTGELSVRYVRPTPVETPLLGRGRVTEDHGKYVDVEATLEDFATGAVTATATARFLPAR